MKTNEGFALGISFVYQAQVKVVKDSCVTFSVLSTDLDGVYYLPKRSQINPHVIFKVGEYWLVKVVKLMKRMRKKEFGSYTEVYVDVVPQNFPTDDFIEKHPQGSIVTGEVKHQYHSGDCQISLAPKVECVVKTCRTLTKGQKVSCKIESYNSLKKKILISLC